MASQLSSQYDPLAAKKKTPLIWPFGNVVELYVCGKTIKRCTLQIYIEELLIIIIQDD